MGCNTSRLDRLPAVALCRDRCKFLDEALRQSYALADAHVTHMESLKTLGPALLCFFDQFEDSGETNEIKPHLSKSPPLHSPSSSSSSSNSDVHVLLHSESEVEDTDKEFQLLTQSRYDYLNYDTALPATDNVAFMNYVEPLYTPFSPPKPPPLPPPHNSSAWDFFNFFEPYERYQVPYNPSGKTDATEEKEKGKAIITQKNDGVGVHGSKSTVGESKVNEEENGEAKNKKADSKEKNSVSEKEPPKSEECSNSNSEKVKSAKGLSDAVKEIQTLFERASNSGNPILEMLDVGKLRYHRKIDFNQVSCKMMHVFTPSIPSNLLSIKCMESSLLGRRMRSGYQGVYKDKGLSYSNLSSTLKKLCMWEKKLYNEVKAEEKLRILHQKKCRQLRRMNKSGADADKVDSVQTFIGILVTKMKISIQVVHKISNMISKLREEELWPQINRFILMFFGMWKDMQECYRRQYQEIAEARTLDASSLNKKLGNSHLDAAIKLKSEVQNWNLSFSDWIHAQKSHVKALNGWLVRCLLYEPEEIPDDSTPFSPGKIGAPPVFVICNKWSRAVDNLSEKNVIEAVNGFMVRVNELLERHILDHQQKITLDKELERKVKILEKQEQKMHKVVQARERKMVPDAREEKEALLRGDAVHHGDIVDTISLQSGLQQIFVAMERFTATTAYLYEELSQQIKQEDHVLGEYKN
ncbi:protein ALTERED PHOSPHATE STARVATION RESPONSE 1-like [Gastrolobium bilobum]|uniref:protein ALTERED PHOSPHATE STARVATION RESPONSE 1-like n=1 Tax=Gastrolobium bilobum TaxID=150636 RepID=UPI002AAF7BC5|nr:protein ALTERED PHOSPHATE STARVATION RESPONSE 1-like [Gastrolobium bilobum]